MNEEALLFQIGITLIKGIGNSLAKNLIAYLGSAEAVFKEKQQNLARIPGIGEVLSHEISSQNILDRAKQEIDFIRKNNIQTYFYLDNHYPYRLKECTDAPIVLYSKGKININNGKFIAIVGTRNATDYGKELCIDLITYFAKYQPNSVIVSGMAYGIDICAHKHAVDSGLSTLAVLGHGLDRLYPSTHKGVADKMLHNGGLISEYLSKTNPDRPNFVQRNRIIAGLTDALVVVESAEKGGALITAEIANEYNRDVFAFPGKVNDMWSAGCNKLIKQNKASLIQSASDVMQFMNWDHLEKQSTTPVQTNLFNELSPEEQELIHALRKKTEGIQVNELAIELAKPYSKISSALLNLEFNGLVKCFPGGIYKTIK